MSNYKRFILFIVFLISFQIVSFSQQNSGTWKDHKTLLYTGAGLYKVFSFTDSKQGETSYVISSTLTFRPNKFIYLNTGIDLYKPESSRQITASINFVPSFGFEEDNIMVCFGAGGALFAGEDGFTLRFLAGFKANYFFKKKFAASLEVKSPLYYDNAAEFLFTAGITFVL